MRVALITPGFSSPLDEWALPALRNLAAGLRARAEVTVYTYAYPHESGEYRIGGVPVLAFGSARTGALAQVISMRRLAGRLCDDHRRKPFDVVHGFWANQGGLLSAFLGRRLRVPSLLTVMAGELTHEASVDYGRRRRIDGRLGRVAALHSSSVATISRYHQERLVHEQHGMATEYLPFGVDTGLFDETGIRAELPHSFNLLLVGSLVPVKGHRTALEALATVRHLPADVHLHVVGKGPLERALIGMAERLGVRSDVTFHGHIPHEKLPAFYRAADLCLLTSHFESSGMVVFEAAACGRLTVGTDVGSLPEITPPDYRVAAGDSTGLAAAIRGLIDSPQERRRLELMVRQRVGEEYTVEHMIERYVRAYEGLRARAPATAT